MLMNGFSCSIGGDGALQVFDGPEADLDLLPCGAIKLKTAPLLPPTKLDLLPEKRPKDSTSLSDEAGELLREEIPESRPRV